MEVSAVQIAVGLILVVRLVEFWVSRRNAERRIAEGAEEIADDLHLAMAIFHALWLATLAFLTEGRSAVDATWLGAGFMLLVLRCHRLLRGRRRWSVRLFKGDRPPPPTERPRHLMRDPCYLPMFAELLVLPLAFGLWWFSLAGTLLYAPLAWRRLAAEGLR